MRLSTLVLAVPALCSALGAQVPATWVPGNVETRSHDYDLVHQRIELRDIDWDSTSLNGRVVTTLVARRVSLDSVILDAAAGIVVRTATDARGRALRTTRTRDTLVVHLASPLRYGDTTRFTLDYHDKIENGRGLTFIYADGRPHRPQQLWSMGETTGNSAWFPTYDFPNDKETLGADRDRPRALHGRLERAPRERRQEQGWHAHHALVAGEAVCHLPHLR